MPELFTAAIATPEGLIVVEFDKMPVEGEQLYAVYCKYGGKNRCFHMMYNTSNLEFGIIDKRNCPYDLYELAYLFSAAIEHHHA